MTKTKDWRALFATLGHLGAYAMARALDTTETAIEAARERGRKARETERCNQYTLSATESQTSSSEP